MRISFPHVLTYPCFSLFLSLSFSLSLSHTHIHTHTEARADNKNVLCNPLNMQSPRYSEENKDMKLPKMWSLPLRTLAPHFRKQESHRKQVW
jgi:hypothetical protein